MDEPCICDYKYALEACDRPATHDVHSIPAEVSHRAGGDHDPQDGVFWFSVFVRAPDDARHCVQIHGGMKIDTLLQIVPFDLGRRRACNSDAVSCNKHKNPNRAQSVENGSCHSLGPVNNNPAH